MLNYSIKMQYAWFIWSILLLIIWIVVYVTLRSKESRKEMLIVSLWTSLFGLTEPIFLYEYWTPLSLFDLNLKTGFDIESVLWSFGVGGIVVVLYEFFFKKGHAAISVHERHAARHRFHLWAVLSVPVTVSILFLATDLNPIYSSIIALLVGSLITLYCRPDLKDKMMVSALLFFGVYFLYFLTLVAAFPGYVESVWNLDAISGILVLGIPLEELAFALTFGLYWSSIYEHIKWRKVTIRK